MTFNPSLQKQEYASSVDSFHVPTDNLINWVGGIPIREFSFLKWRILEEQKRTFKCFF